MSIFNPLAQFKKVIAIEGLKFLKAGFAYANAALVADHKLAPMREEFVAAEQERIIARLENEYPGFLGSDAVAKEIIAQYFNEAELAEITANPEKYLEQAIQMLTAYEPPTFLVWAYRLLRFKGKSDLRFNFENRGWTYINQHLEAYGDFANDIPAEFAISANYAIDHILPFAQQNPAAVKGLEPQLVVLADWALKQAELIDDKDESQALINKAEQLKAVFE